MANESLLSFVKGAPSYVKARVFLLLAFGLFVVMGAFASILCVWKMHQHPLLTEQVLEQSRKSASVEASPFAFGYEIKDMSMAFISKKGTRTAYSQFTIILDCPSEESKHVMELNRAKIINGIFEAGSDFYVDDFQAPLAQEGFENFKSQIKKTLTEYFPSHVPRMIAIKDWVMN